MIKRLPFLKFLPSFMKLDDVFYFMFFFLSGYMLKEKWQFVKEFCAKYWYITITVFVLANFMFVMCTHIHVWHRHLMNCFGIEIYSLAIQIHEVITTIENRAYVLYNTFGCCLAVMPSRKEVMPMTTYETLMVALTAFGIVCVVLVEYIKK